MMTIPLAFIAVHDNLENISTSAVLFELCSCCVGGRMNGWRDHHLSVRKSRLRDFECVAQGQTVREEQSMP